MGWMPKFLCGAPVFQCTGEYDQTGMIRYQKFGSANKQSSFANRY